MSSGSTIIQVRFPDDLLTSLLVEIDRVNRLRTHEPYNTSSWIRQAVADKLAHCARGRKCRKTAASPQLTNCDEPMGG
jgi:hypothetical protein